jgi:dTDP-4-dehydrorhamnose reductase
VTKIIVLGASGMLGSMAVDYLSSDGDIELSATARSREIIKKMSPRASNVAWRLLDAERCNIKDIVDALGSADWVINAIGVIKPYIRDDNAAETERAIAVNALFPHLLARAAAQTGCRVLQIATDCAYSGHRGRYSEKDEHDPLDVYGKTKSLGEVFSDSVYHLRCSIIGPETKGHLSLMDWFLGQPPGGRVNGYTNHQWNGITTLHFAKICRGIIQRGLNLPHVQHVIPADTISKAELLKCFAREYQRQDITITPGKAVMAVDRTLATTGDSLNRKIWEAAGYKAPPSIPQMVAELAAFNYRFSLEGAI